ncbi:MAG: polymerase, beta domain protein region protein [Candidatus Daviesbacteria bacterium GW2011_GWA1_41_61]|uniref:Polymerase, beta domain protein region protein n=1 Tax=Candidatus Daviesbacteria bacterium GW2011_GWA2_40_9 TaxID=1618424 RepID=A0A0G0U7J7_9BACT|nr:MAG: polymerase beta domain protein region protein [Candidatus Daviesbacteria bacterium GW2011_GWC1_40_9]KKR83166.1 MAG: polymerase, beta domain protein region protein [Candidatus Daviesbacteria bacterium GW2011_GWA2_40_9]KKR93513.1 MAG: polymerase, beta domain protein region protein [Candidatus Daviesbacteria bacterium GW2011_GWB1_41_15]KKS14938.1 MAG: polymerase, beta domain protein region protein [Candidatus Daviesbacteria bacterium GW2011_GWA1_41_61]
MTQVQIQDQIDSIKNQLIEKYKPQKIFLFGSSVTGKMTEDSDLDFLIIKDDKKDPYNRIVEVYHLIEKDIAADFLVYTPQEFSERLKLGDPFVTSIPSEGKVLYG